MSSITLSFIKLTRSFSTVGASTIKLHPQKCSEAERTIIALGDGLFFGAGTACVAVSFIWIADKISEKRWERARIEAEKTSLATRNLRHNRENFQT